MTSNIIYSTLLDSDPDLRDIVEMFTNEMPERIGRIEALWDARDLPELKRYAHKLKGAGGSHGFGILSERTSELENLIDRNADEKTIQTAIESLIDICNRITPDIRKE